MKTATPDPEPGAGSDPATPTTDPATPGTVYLVGAGPGDPGLITVRGARVLGFADVVAYDRLVNPAVLELAARARHEFVGRTVGDPDRQEAINRLLISEARAGRTVVRLKGGDPFVFGRGGEECDALADAGIPFEVVPGISSAVAAPAYAGIPVTHRAHASWLAIATGQTGPSGRSLDWPALAAADTGVYLMGLQALGEVVGGLLDAGKDPQTPVAVISRASWPSQRTVISTLQEAVSDVKAADVQPPAVLVVGTVAGLARRLDWVSARRPLLGRRVLVARPAGSDPGLADRLRDLGADVVAVATTRIAPAPDPQALHDAVGALVGGRYAWVVFASRNAVDAVDAALLARGSDARALGDTRVAAVGPATAGRLRDMGIRADLVGSSARADVLAEELGSPAPGSRGRVRRVLLPRPADAPAGLPRALRKAGWRPDVVAAYATVFDDSDFERGREAIDAGVDAVVLTAPSGAEGYVRLWGSPPEAVVVCCIGPSTAEGAKRAGLRADVVAAEHTASGVAAALVSRLVRT